MKSSGSSAHYNPQSKSFSEAIIDAVATHKKVDAIDLDPLYEEIDPDAVNALFRPENGQNARIVFEYCGCMVTARANGEIIIRKAKE